MARFTNKQTRKPSGFTATKKDEKPTLTYQGGIGHSKEEKTELYSRLVTERFSDTFYESAQFREGRIVQLAMGLAKSDPVWFSKMVGWLRNDANLRSVSVLCAAIYANAHKGVSELPEGALNVRAVCDSACARADDPVELLAVYLNLFGRSLPQGLRNGLGDACRRLWNEYSVLKYNRSAQVDMRDVLSLAHIKADPKKLNQDALFSYVIDSNYDNELKLERLPLISKYKTLAKIPRDQRKKFLAENPDQAEGLTWEFMSSWLGGLDADGWASAIDQMGYMALLRNLRNFEKHGVAKPVLQKVRDRISDPEEVARSRQLPYRFYSAKVATGSDYFASALNDAFETSIDNLSPLPGRTLVMVDGSGSMMGGGKRIGQSFVSPNEQASVLAAIAISAWDCDVEIYDTNTKPITFKNKKSALSNAAEIAKNSHGGGTDTWGCVDSVLASKPKGYYSRILAFTDGQEGYRDHAWYSWSNSKRDAVDAFKGNVFVWDLSGYSTTNLDLGIPGRYVFAGFDDNSFSMIERLENGTNIDWPWV